MISKSGKTIICFLVLTLAGFIYGCTPRTALSADEQKQQKMIVEVIKSPCYGDCPVYDFKVFSTGQAELEAKNNMNWVGSYASRMSRSKIGHIRKMFERIDFFSLEDQYTSLESDAPTTEIWYKKGDQEKKVKFYGDGPEDLKNLITELQEIVDDTEWKRTVSEM